MIKKFIIVLILLLTAGNPIQAEQADTKEKEKLIIAISQEYPPLTMLNAEGNSAGLFVDLWRLWAEKTGQQIEFRATDWSETITGLKNGEADIHSGLFRSEERATWIDFSQPFYETESAIFYAVRKVKIDNVNDLKGKKVGSVLGTHQADYLKTHYPDIEVIEFREDNEMLSAAVKGEVSAFIGEVLTVQVLAIQLGMQGEFKYLKEPRYSEKIFAGVHKGNTELLKLIDKGLNQITNEEISEIESRWIPNPESRYYKSHANKIRLTAEEEAWIREHKVLRVGVGVAWPPFQYMDTDGEFKGIASDYIRILNERLGLNMVVVKGISWKEVLERAKKKEIDIFACATETPDRKEYMNFTPPYLISPLVIITQKDAPFVGGLDDLHGKKLAIVKALATYPKIIKLYPGIIPYLVSIPEDKLEAVSLGKADACIDNLAVASYLIQKKNLTNLKVAAPAPLPTTDLSFAVRKDWDLLLNIINKGLNSITQEEHNEIRQKWIAVRYEHGISAKQILQIIGAAVFILTLVLLWNFQIRRQEERFRGLTEHRLDITQAFDKNGIITYQSPSHTDILGYKAGELIGTSAFALFHKDEIEQWQHIIASLLSGEQVHTFIHRIRHKEGNYHYFESNCLNMLDNKALKAIVVNARDITEQKAAEEALHNAHKELIAKAAELEEVNKELSQYTYVVSHDLRAPLRAIHNYSDFLIEDLGDSLEEEQKMYLDGMNRAVCEANALTEDLLILSRIGRQHVPIEEIKVGTFIQNLCNSLDIPSDVQVKIADDMPVIEAEPVLLRQIFQNLLSNAIKFNKNPQKEVKFDWNPVDEETYEFSVQDNGIGIDIRFYQQIFRVFERLHVREEFEGTGIGLAIVKKAATKMGGAVRVESELGKGSRFVVKLPKKQPEVSDE